jgi:alkylation response protein AidB-like acyl-CoA dehydrogenase
MGLRQEVWEIHPDEFISRARKLHPVLKQRAQKIREDRKVPKETIQELKDAEFFRMMRPKKWGGYEKRGAPSTIFLGGGRSWWTQKMVLGAPLFS